MYVVIWGASFSFLSLPRNCCCMWLLLRVQLKTVGPFWDLEASQLLNLLVDLWKVSPSHQMLVREEESNGWFVFFGAVSCSVVNESGAVHCHGHMTYPSLRLFSRCGTPVRHCEQPWLPSSTSSPSFSSWLMTDHSTFLRRQKIVHFLSSRIPFTLSPALQHPCCIHVVLWYLIHPFARRGCMWRSLTQQLSACKSRFVWRNLSMFQLGAK